MKTIMRNKPLMRLAVCLIGMAALIYGTFDVFLNVPLPEGIIMEEFL